MNMLIINCENEDELVTLNLDNPCLMFNIYRQDEGILVNAVDDIRSIEALITDTSCTPAIALERIQSGRLEVDEIVIDPDVEAEDGEDSEVGDTEWTGR